MFGKNRTRSEPCNAYVNGENCGETQTLAILDEFQKLYETKLIEIDTSNEYLDKPQEKIRTLRAWVSDLTEQNQMLVQAVEELEEEASQRVTLLENKLREHSQQAYNRMSDAYATYNQQQSELVQYLRSDITNLIEVIRRARDEGVLNAEGLSFYEVRCTDLYGNKGTPQQCQLKENLNEYSELSSKLEKTEKERLNLQIELDNSMIKFQEKVQENENLLAELSKLEKSTRDMREALTAEVADKHDSIRALRREYQNLEEQCRQIDKQAHFKDDIIKELRKELRAVKKDEKSGPVVPREVIISEMIDYRNYLLGLKNALYTLKKLIEIKYECLNDQEDKISSINKNIYKLTQTFSETKHELDNLHTLLAQNMSGNTENEHRIKKTRDSIYKLQNEYQNTRNFESITNMFDEIKALDILYKEREKSLLVQEIHLNRIKKSFNTNTSDLQRLQGTFENFLQDSFKLDKRIDETEKKMHLVQKDLLNAYCNVKKGFKSIDEFSEELMICNDESQLDTLGNILEEMDTVKNHSNYVYIQTKKINNENKELKQQLKDLQEFMKVQSIETICETTCTGVNTDLDIENIVKQLKSELEKSHVEKKRLEKLVETYIEKLKNVQSDVSLLQDLNEDLHDSLVSTNDEKEHEQPSIIEIEEKITSFKRKISDLEYSLAAKDVINENLQKAVQLHQSTINELKKQCEESQINNDNQQQIIEHLQEDLLSVKRELTEMETKRLKEVNDLNGMLYSLQFDLNCFEDIYLIMWNSLIQYYQNDFRLRETIFDLEVHNFNLKQDVVILQIQVKDSTSYLNLIWKNKSLQREMCLLRAKLHQAENDNCKKIEELLKLRKEIEYKNQFLNSIIEIVDNSDEKSTSSIEMEELIPNLKQKIFTINDLNKRLHDQDQILSELRIQINDYQQLDNYIQKMANTNFDYSTLDTSLAKNDSNTQNELNDTREVTVLNVYNLTNTSNMKSSASILSLETIQSQLEMAQKVIYELRKRINECKCEEFVKEIQKLREENINLKKTSDNGILNRETFIKLYDELSDDMVETKTYLKYLQDLLKNDTYTDDLESKNYTLASTILEMEKYIECLKLELADAANKASQSIASVNNERIDGLEACLKGKQSEINNLTSLLSIKESCISKLEDDNKESSEKIANLHETLNKTNEKNEIYDNLIDKTVTEMCNCKRSFETIHEKAQWLQDTLSQKFSELSTIQNDSKTNIETINELRKQVSEEKQKYYDDMEKLSSTVKKLENQVKNEISRNKTLENGLLMIERELESRQKRERDLIENLTNNEKYIQDLKQTLNCERDSKSNIENRKRMKDVIHENQLLKETIREMENAITKLNFDQENIDKKYQILQIDSDVQLYDVTNQLTSLQIEHEMEIEKYKRHLEKSEKTVEDLNKILKSKCENHDEKVKELSEILTAKENEMKDLTVEHALKLTQMEAKYHEMLTRFERDLAEKNQLIDELKDLLKKIDFYNKKLTDDSIKLQKSIEEKNQLICELTASNDKYLNEKSELFGKEISKYQDELKENEESTKILNSVVLTQKRKIEELNSEIITLKEELIKRQLTLDKVTNKYKDVIHGMKRNYESIETKAQNELSDLDIVLKSFRENVRDKEKLVKSQSQELFILRLQLNEKNSVIEEHKRRQMKLKNELDSALNEIMKYEDKVFQKDRLIENLQGSLDENFVSFNYDEELAEVWKLVTEKDNFIKEIVYHNEKFIKNLENQYLEEIERCKVLNDEYERKLQNAFEENNTNIRKIKDIESEKLHLQAELQKKEKILQSLLQNNKMFFHKTTNKYIQEIDKFHKINLQNENLIKELQSMRNISNTYYQSTNEELNELKLHLDEKDKIIEQLIVSHYHADNELINQCQMVVNQCKSQIAENEKCIKNLRKNLVYKDQQLTNEHTEKQRLLNELESKNTIITKLIASTEEHCKNIENEWKLKFQNLQTTNSKQEQKNNLLESSKKTLTNTVDSLRNLINDLRQEIFNSKKRIQSNQNTYETDLNSLIARHKKELFDYNKRLVQKEKEKQEMKFNFDQLLQKFKQNSNMQLNRLNAGNDENLNEKQDQSYLSYKIQILKIELGRIRNINELVRNEITQFKNHVHFQDILINELETQNRQCIRIIENKKIDNKSMNELKAILNEAQKQSIKNLVKANLAILEKDTEIEKLLSDQESTESIESLFSSLKSLDSDLSLRNHDFSLDNILKTMEKQIEKFEKDNIGLNESMERINLKNHEFIKDMENHFEKELNTCNIALTDRETQIKDLNESIQHLECESLKLREENNELKCQLIEKDRSILDGGCINDNLTSEVKYYRHQVMERDEMIKELTQTISIYKNMSLDVNYLQAELSEKDHIICELEEELQLRNPQICDDTGQNQLVELQCKFKELRKKFIESNKENFCLNERLNNEMCVQNKLKTSYDNEIKRNQRNEMIISGLNKQLVNKNNIIKSFEQFKMQTEPKICQLTETLTRLSHEIEDKEHMIEYMNENFQNDYQKIIDDFNENISKVDTFDDRFFSKYISIIQEYNHRLYEQERKLEVLNKTNIEIKGQFNRFISEINCLKQQLTDKEKYLDLLQQNQQNVIEVLNNNFDKEKQKSTDELESTLNEKLTKIDTLLVEINTKNEFICNQTKIHNENLEEIDRFKNIIEDQRKIIDNLNLTLNEVNGKNENDIQKRIEYETKNFNQLTDMKRANCDLQSIISELNIKIETLKVNNRNLKRKLIDNENCYKVQQEKVIRDNEKLKNHLTKFINNYGKSDTQVQQSQSTTSAQLEVCLKIISELRNEKAILEADNIALSEEVSRLNTELYERCQEIVSKQQKIENLEKDINDLDKSREELRTESKQVLENVRCWMEEQRQINLVLNDNMNQKCGTLERFKKERLNLLNEIDMLKQSNRQLISENNLLKRKIRGQSTIIYDEHPCKNLDSSSFGSTTMDTTSNSTSVSNITCPNKNKFMKSHCHDPNHKHMP